MAFSDKLAKTAWFARAEYGFFFHFLNPHHATAEHPDQKRPHGLDEWNREVDSFNVELFAMQLAELHAGYVFLSVGQNSGWYCSPNRTYEEYLGAKRCSGRDLIADFADALAKYHIPLLAYSTGLAPYFDRLAVEKLNCVPPWEHLSCGTYNRYRDLITGDARLSDFLTKWSNIHREWSLRWRGKVRGW